MRAEGRGVAATAATAAAGPTQYSGAGFVKSRVLKKDDRLGVESSIVKIMANRKINWQGGDKKGGGGGGSSGGGGGGSGGGGKKGGGKKADSGQVASTKKERDLDKMLKRLKRSFDRQGKAKSGKGASGIGSAAGTTAGGRAVSGIKVAKGLTKK